MSLVKKTRRALRRFGIAASHLPVVRAVVHANVVRDAEILLKVIAAVEAAIAAEHREVYVIYMHPCFTDCFDASPVFKRFFETRVDFAPEERGYGHVSEGKFIIWRGTSNG